MAARSVAPPGLVRYWGMIQGLRARFASHLPLATFWPRLRRYVSALRTAPSALRCAALVEHISWRAVFFSYLPLALAVLIISVWRVPESREEREAANHDGDGLRQRRTGGSGFRHQQRGFANRGPVGNRRVWSGDLYAFSRELGTRLNAVRVDEQVRSSIDEQRVKLAGVEVPDSLDTQHREQIKQAITVCVRFSSNHDRVRGAVTGKRFVCVGLDW